MRLNVQLFDHKSQPTARLAVFAYVVPDDAMGHKLLLSADSWWFRFPVREYFDVGEGKSTLRLQISVPAENTHVSAVKERKFVAFVESSAPESCGFRLVYNSQKPSTYFTDEKSWVPRMVQ